METEFFGSIVIGAGAAGCAASIYLSRYKLKHLIFGQQIGGQFFNTTVVENYPGFTSILGPDLAQRFQDHVEIYGAKIRQEKITAIRKRKSNASTHLFEVQTEGGNKFMSKTVILAMGAQYKQLNVPGEKEFTGRGVAYCHTCDAPLFAGKEVAVVGGGDSALSAVLHLADFAKKIYLIHRRDEYRAQQILVDRMRQKSNVVEIKNNEVMRILGAFEISGKPAGGVELVGGVKLKNEFDRSRLLKVQGVFIEIGLMPTIGLTKGLGLDLTDDGYIKVRVDRTTNLPGVFAAGDIARVEGSLHFRQIINSASEGAEAAAAVYQYLLDGVDKGGKSRVA